MKNMADPGLRVEVRDAEGSVQVFLPGEVVGELSAERDRLRKELGQLRAEMETLRTAKQAVESERDRYLRGLRRHGAGPGLDGRVVDRRDEERRSQRLFSSQNWRSHSTRKRGAPRMADPPAPFWSVHYSGVILQRLRRYYQRSKALGIGGEYLGLIRTMKDRLQTDALSWGDPLYTLPTLQLVIYRRIHGFLVVYYGVDERNRRVFVNRIEPLPNHPMAQDA